jgi:hypothetical protein
LTDGTLITAFSNNPNLLNLRNDYIVWGTYKTTNGTELPIHMRYAIDKKPEKYVSLDWYDKKDKEKIIKESTIYTTEEYDWRELIY